MDLSRVATAIGRLRARLRGGVASAAASPRSDTQPKGLEAWEREIVEEALHHTMTSTERIVAAMDAVGYVLRRPVPGALVECGVWRGGSVLAMIRCLQREGVDDRDIYLFDTFEGMTRPTELDTSRYDPPALETWAASERDDTTPWQGFFNADVFNIARVRSLTLGPGYPEQHVHFVQGRVEAPLPEAPPAAIALLRLDTDWYESTWHELSHLYGRV